MTYILGIDGGGTKTEALLCNNTGHVLAHVMGGPSNLQNEGAEAVLAVLQGVVESALRLADVRLVDIDTIALGAGGLDTNHDRRTYDEVMARIAPSRASVWIENDSVIGLYSGTYGKPGLCVVAGTGSIVGGVGSDGKVLRAGGWGYLIGDVGSAFDIGRRALIAALAAHDGLGPPTLLETYVPRHFSAPTIEDAVATIYRAASPPTTLATLSQRVDEAAENGDSMAANILKAAAADLAASAAGVLEQLRLDDDEKRVVLVGSVFSSSRFCRDFTTSLTETSGSVTFIKPQLRPVCGAIIMGLQRAAIHDSSSTLIDNLRVWSLNMATRTEGGDGKERAS